MNHYYKRHWDETKGDSLTDSWGTSTFYFETTELGDVLRQVQVFSNGRKLKYDSTKLEDEYGGLSDAALDLIEFEQFKIDKDDFEEIWKQANGV